MVSIIVGIGEDWLA